MVAEAWIVKMGSQVSSNLKQALLLESSTKKNFKTPVPKKRIEILSFEVANVMSKTIHLHRSLSDSEISKLKSEILQSEGVKSLVSSDENYLLDLALAEKLDDLNRVSLIVSRLGKKCTEPALLGFEHVYSDIVNGVIDVRKLGFLVKDMEGMVKKMERYVNATSNLYCEMEVLNELEQGAKKFQHNQHEESRRAFEQKLIWQRQDVKHLRDTSLWNQTYDKVVEMLARTVCTIFVRICVVFGDAMRRSNEVGSNSIKNEASSPVNYRISGKIDGRCDSSTVSGPLRRISSMKNGARLHPGIVSEKPVLERKATSFKHRVDPQRGESEFFRAGDLNFPCGTNPGRLVMDCFSMSSSVSKLDDDDAIDDCSVDRCDQSSQLSSCYSVPNGGLNTKSSSNPLLSRLHIRQQTCSETPFGPKSRLALYAASSTIGGSALALHYANVIIVIEKLLRYPHLVGEDARNDLYQMLPTSLRLSLKTNLRSYFKNISIYDAPLAHDWKQTLDGILGWLVPLAHNMIRWQSERNFEQQQIVKRTNVLLLQTLYFADRVKIEAAICKVLLGLNYICHYEHQQNALLDCASSFDYEDCLEWQRQCRASYFV